MKEVKHFSFDLWLTLIKSNPEFKKERVNYFYTKFNFMNKSIEHVEKSFRYVDLMCNSINEKTGKNIDAEEMYLMVLYQINGNANSFDDIDTSKLYVDIENLLFKYSPTLYCDTTIKCLENIKHNENLTTNILSNTAFIKGKTLREVLERLKISKYFDFQIYSDEVFISKPNIDIYELLINNVRKIRSNLNIERNEIIHVGDNPIADIKGANSAGLRSFQINSNHQLISNLLIYV